jgi:hypothetical protein
MALIDDVRSTCGRLAAGGWAATFRDHGLNLGAADFEAELGRPLAVRRDRPGMDDFVANATRAIEPGSLAGSLLYHLLASPDVVVPGLPLHAYPSLGDLDTVENYVFAAARRRLSSFQQPVVAVFAYQYRAGFRSAHGLHADAVFSRTGLSRVGLRPPFYDGTRRGFWVIDPDDKDAFAVMPARFAAFIAEASQPSTNDAVLRPDERDRTHTFLFPRHKLFPGSECLVDVALDRVEFREWHATEKLRRIHTAGKVPLPDGFDMDAPPFVRGSDALVTLQPVGASALIVPIPRERFVRVARQRQTASDRDEVVRFVVPPDNRRNRFTTSFQITAHQHGRAAPEYVNIRTRVGRGGKLENLNDLSEAKFDEALTKGGYQAAHYVDDTCDGAITAAVAGLPAGIRTYAAYSLVSPPDFMPRVDQIDVQRWADSNLRRLGDHFNQGSPAPLCDGRNSGASRIGGKMRRGRAPNPAVCHPFDQSAAAFDRDDLANLTITAVVGPPPRTEETRVAARASRAATFLPDAASDVFAPGWDISQFGDDLGEFYQNYGLGSPFPEDAKLCAALNSFWPAAAPDAGRTFPELGGKTALPLLDDELGFHPDDPRVRRGEVRTRRGWDGEYGPFFSKDGTVNVASVARSDYVRNAVEGRLVPGRLAEIDTREILSRMDALRFCIRSIPPADTVANTELWLVSARAVDDWSARPDRASERLSGPGYLFIFARPVGDSQPTRDPRRRRMQVKQVTTCQIAGTSLCWRAGDGPFHEVARPPFEPILARLPGAPK